MRPRRSTRFDRRLVLVMVALATVTSALAVLAMGLRSGDFAAVTFFPAAGFAILTGSLAAGRARVAPGRAFLAERILLTPIIWLGLVARALADMTLPFNGSGDSGAEVSSWLLGGVWAWAALGAGAFGVKRLYEREAAFARLARRRGSKPAAPRLVLIITSAAALAVVVRLLVIHADVPSIVVGALVAGLGALLVQRGFPRGVRSPMGRGMLLAGLFALSMSLTPFWAIPVSAVAASDSSRPDYALIESLALALSYTALGAWLLMARPFAAHEWRLLLRSSRTPRAVAPRQDISS